MWRGTEKNKRKNTGKQSKANKQRETSTGKERNKGHLHWVKEEEHDEEGDRGPKGKTHRLHAVQGCHTVLSPAKYILVLDFKMFFVHRIYLCIWLFAHSFGDLIFFAQRSSKTSSRSVSSQASLTTNASCNLLLRSVSSCMCAVRTCESEWEWNTTCSFHISIPSVG